MTGYFWDEFLHLFKRRFRGQPRAMSAAETLFIYFSAAFLAFGFLGSSIGFLPAGSVSAFLLGNLALIMGALWFLCGAGSELKLNLFPLIFLPPAACGALFADPTFSREILMLWCMAFLFVNMARLRTDIYIFGSVFVACGVLAGIYGIKSFEFSRAAMGVQDFSMPQIGAGFMGGVYSLSLLLCSVLSILVPIFVGRRFPPSTRMFSIAMFAVVWYSIFRTANLWILFLASAAIIFEGFAVAVPRDRRFFVFWFLILIAGTCAGLLWVDSSGLLSGSCCGRIISSYESVLDAGWIGPSKVSQGVNGELPGLVKFARNYGLLAGILLCAAVLYAFSRAVAAFMKIPVERWHDGRVRCAGQKIEEIFKSKRSFYAAHSETPAERIFEVGSIAAFVSCALIFSLSNIEGGFRAALAFSAVGIFLSRGISGRCAIKIRAGLIRRMSAILIAAVSVYSLFGIGDCLENMKSLPDGAPVKTSSLREENFGAEKNAAGNFEAAGLPIKTSEDGALNLWDSIRVEDAGNEEMADYLLPEPETR